jgi:hypothetical protein
MNGYLWVVVWVLVVVILADDKRKDNKMTRLHRQVGLLTTVERLNCSKNGNPRYRLTITHNGSEATYRTLSDASYSYDVGNIARGIREGSGVLVEFSVNSRGTVTYLKGLENNA